MHGTTWKMKSLWICHWPSCFRPRLSHFLDFHALTTSILG